MLNTKKIIAVLSAALISFSTVCSVFAEPTPAPETTETAEIATDDVITMENPELTAPDTSHAGAALLMDVNSNRIIYGKNIDKKMYPASTTKMMTAILALENGDMNETVVATPEAIEPITLEDSQMGVLIGEELSMTDLVNSTLIHSANDASNVIAVHIGGSLSGFVDMMNQKADELGMNDTHFENACGIHDDNHYTTAKDLAILAKYCMQNETFREIVKKPSYHIPPTNKYQYDRYLHSTNLFLGTARSASHVYSACTGIKTGTTEKAGHCLVSSAEHEDHMSLISVVLNCDDTNVNEGAYSYIISKALFDFAFSNYESTVVKQPGSIVGSETVKFAKNGEWSSLTVDADISALVPRGADISQDITTEFSFSKELVAPIQKDEVLGEVTFLYHGTEIGKAHLIAANDVERNNLLFFIETYVKNPLIYIPVILIIIAAMIAVSHKRRNDRRKKLHQIRQRREANMAKNVTTDRVQRNFEKNRMSSKGSNSRYTDDR